MQPTGNTSTNRNLKQAWSLKKLSFIATLILFAASCAMQGNAQNRVLHSNMHKTFEHISEINGQFEHAYHVSLINQNLTEVPKEIGQMPNLNTLYLSDNKISTLGDAFFQSFQLTLLNLDNNDLREIHFSALKYCSRLEDLHLRSNNIEKIPADLGQLKYLKELDIGDNKVQTLDTSLYLPYMTNFRADANRLEAVPEFLKQCKNLGYLNLNGNRIGDLSGIEKLTRLRALNIGDNPITSIAAISQLHDLEHFMLDWIDLDTVNQSGLEQLKKLRILSVEHCSLQKLPVWITSQKNLEELSLIGNNLTEIPNSLYQMKRLKKLWLSKNPIPQEQIEDLRRKLSRCEVIFDNIGKQ